jgi:hypothetical protein
MTISLTCIESERSPCPLSSLELGTSNPPGPLRFREMT